MKETSSYRQILRASYISGVASVINIILGIIRMKAAAVLLGPAGVGLIGILQQIMVTATALAGVGLTSSGTRQIAAASQDNDERLAATQHALIWGALILALVGGLIVWIFRAPIAAFTLNDQSLSYLVGWMALGVTLSIAAGSQIALLNGLRKIEHIARVNIYAAVLSTVVGIPAIFAFSENGIVILIISVPFSNLIISYIYASGLQKFRANSKDLSEIYSEWRNLIRLGGAFMIAGAAFLIAQLLIRSMVQKELGPVALGEFTASWMISMTYIGFVLGAMATDYYPRLTGIIKDHPAVNRLVNEQTEIALLFSGPILIAMMTLAPWVIEILYTKDFKPAAEILRWQILGDILKLASWPLGFIILAAANSKTFMLTESLGAFIMLGSTWVAIPYFGVTATGISFLFMYIFYLPVVYWLAKKRTGFRWSIAVVRLIIIITLACVAVAVIDHYDQVYGVVLGLSLTAVGLIYSISKLKGHLRSTC